MRLVLFLYGRPRIKIELNNCPVLVCSDFQPPKEFFDRIGKLFKDWLPL